MVRSFGRVVGVIGIAVCLGAGAAGADQTAGEGQVADFAKRAEVVSAMKEFRAAFTRVRTENRIANTSKFKGKLKAYYTEEFAKQYKNKNNGRPPDVAAMFSRLDDDSITLQYYYMTANPNPLGVKHLLDRASDKSSWSATHAKYHPGFRDYLEDVGLYDIFLVDPKTHDIVYTCFKELDFTTNLGNGPYADTGLGEVYKAVRTGPRGATKISQIEPYLPSYDLPAQFVSAPVYDGKKLIGVVIFQLRIE